MTDPTARTATTSATGTAATAKARAADARTASGSGGSGTRGSGFGPRLVVPMMLGSVLNPINSTMIATTLVAIGRAFHVGASDTAWLVSSLYVASAVAQPTMGRLADRLGPRRVFLGGLVIVAAAGVVGALAPALGWLIVSRVLLGIGTSAAYPAAMALLRAHSQALGVPTPRPVLGLLSLSGLSSAAIGPVLGGVLAATLGWRAVFAVNVPLAALAFVLAALWLPADRAKTGRALADRAKANRKAGEQDRPEAGRGAEAGAGALDPLGVLLFAGVLTTLMLFLMRLADPMWPLLPLVAVLAAALAGWELRHRAPFLDLRMLGRNRPLSLTYLRHGMTYLVIYSVMYGYAQWLEEAHGFSSARAGLLILPMSVAAMVTSLLGARTRGIRVPLTAAAVLLIAGGGALLAAGHTSPALALAAAGVLFGLPQGLASTGNQAAVYAQAPPGQTGNAAGLQRTAQYIGAVSAASLIGLFYGDHATDHGLHEMGLLSVVLSMAVLLLTALDRSLRRGRGAQQDR